MKLQNAINLLDQEEVVTLEHGNQHHIIVDRKTVRELLNLTMYVMDLKRWKISHIEIGKAFNDLIISIVPV